MKLPSYKGDCYQTCLTFTLVGGITLSSLSRQVRENLPFFTWRETLSLSSKEFWGTNILEERVRSKTANVLLCSNGQKYKAHGDLPLNTYNNNNNNGVMYSLKELWICHRRGHNHVCLGESRSKRRYFLTWYKGGRNPDKGNFKNVRAPTAAPRQTLVCRKAPAPLMRLWGLPLVWEGYLMLLWALGLRKYNKNQLPAYTTWRSISYGFLKNLYC